MWVGPVIGPAYHRNMTNRDQVQDWLDRYVAAWRESRPELVEALFTQDAVYRFRPYGGDGRVLEGRDSIVADWVEEPDDPAAWDAAYTLFAVDGERAVATGISRYLATADEPDEVYHNCFLLRFDPEGRCAEFTEYWMLEPPPG
jgi:hypothetical protein